MNQSQQQLIDKATDLMLETQKLVWGATPDAIREDIPIALQSTLLAECMGQHIGVRACISERVGSPANAIVRGLLDNAVFLIYMSRHADEAPFIALRWYRSKTLRQRLLVEEGARLHNIEKPEIVKTLDDELKRIVESGKELGYDDLSTLPSTPDMAASFGSKRITKHGSGILSQYVHSGVDSLARRLAPKEGTAGVFSVRDESAYDLVQTASLANASLFDAGIAVARLQDWRSLDALAEVAMEYSSLFAQLKEETEAAS